MGTYWQKCVIHNHIFISVNSLETKNFVLEQAFYIYIGSRISSKEPVMLQLNIFETAWHGGSVFSTVASQRTLGVTHWVGFSYSLCVCIGPFQVLRLLPKVKRRSSVQTG